jgi:hypothetical protein
MTVALSLRKIVRLCKSPRELHKSVIPAWKECVGSDPTPGVISKLSDDATLVCYTTMVTQNMECREYHDSVEAEIEEKATVRRTMCVC